MMDWDDVLEVFVGTLLAGLLLIVLAPRIRGRSKGWFG